jgi:hypothetical protein
MPRCTCGGSEFVSSHAVTHSRGCPLRGESSSITPTPSIDDSHHCCKGESDCICGHLAHDDECPEQVRLGGDLHPCGCDDYVPTRFESTQDYRRKETP